MILLVALLVVLVNWIVRVALDPLVYPNSESMFGMDFGALTLVIGTASLALTVGILVWGRCNPYGIGLFAGGCLANLIDRVVYGHVKDYIQFDNVAFNVADIAIVGGVMILILSTIKGVSNHAEDCSEDRSDGDSRTHDSRQRSAQVPSGARGLTGSEGRPHHIGHTGGAVAYPRCRRCKVGHAWPDDLCMACRTRVDL